EGRARGHSRRATEEPPPAPADEAELAEALKIRERERRIRHSRRERRAQRSGARAPDRDGQRRLDAHAAPALLDITGEEDDPEVDPVADDDRAEECGVRVELVDVERRGRREGERVEGRQKGRREGGGGR